MKLFRETIVKYVLLTEMSVSILILVVTLLKKCKSFQTLYSYQLIKISLNVNTYDGTVSVHKYV